MRFSVALGDFLITQSSRIVKSCCGDVILSSLRHSEIVKSHCGDETLRGPGDFLITQAPGIVKSCCGDEILRGP